MTHAYLTVSEYGHGYLTKGLPVVDRILSGREVILDEDGKASLGGLRPEEVVKFFGGKMPEVEPGKTKTFLVRVEEAE